MKGYPTLENKWVRLSPLAMSDVVTLLPLVLQEPDLFRLMSVQLHSLQDLHQFIQVALADCRDGKSLPFLITDKRSGHVVGSTRFGNIEQTHKRLEIGWTFIAQAAQGTGLNKAMKYLMLAYAFEQLDMNRVEIKTNEQNLRSRRAIESIGAIQEGIFRHHMIMADGSLRNTVYYSILKEEWPQIKSDRFGKYIQEW